MTSMQRVLAAVAGTDADRRAFTMTLSLYGAKLTDCPPAEYYTNPKNYLAGQIAVSRICKPDIIFSPFALALEAKAFGSEIVALDKSPPTVKKPFIRNTGDIDKIRVPDIGTDEGLQYLVASVKHLTDHFGTTVPVCGVLTSPMDLPAIIMGVENWLEILLFERDKALKVIAAMSEYFVDMANTLFENGVAFVAMAMVFSNPKILFEKTIAEFIVPELARIFAQIKGPIVFHHGAVPIAGYLHLYTGLPNVAGFVLDQRDKLTTARESVGDDVLLLGNLDGPTLGKITAAKAIGNAKRILDNRINDKRFIFATSSADVPWNAPLETITGIYDLVQTYKGGKS